VSCSTAIAVAAWKEMAANTANSTKAGNLILENILVSPFDHKRKTLNTVNLNKYPCITP
jgi:hypothetical protein